jgi:DnaJ family protein C protein 8
VVLLLRGAMSGKASHERSSGRTTSFMNVGIEAVWEHLAVRKGRLDEHKYLSGSGVHMSTGAGIVTLVPKGQEVERIDEEMVSFLAQVQMVQSLADIAALSGSEHIARLHRPGAKYFNMNPFEVLGLTHKATSEEVRAAYRRLSVKVHPDKNPDNERAQSAFEAVKAASERLEDEERLAFCVRICTAAEEAVERKVKAQKKKQAKAGEGEAVPEDDPDKMSIAVKIMICRMFAEFEQRKAQLEKQDAEHRKKAKEEQAEREFMEALKKQEEKMWEKSRQKRVNGWRNWAGSGGHKSKMPRLKEERREDGGSGYNAHNDERGEEYKKDWR